ncbi:MAG: tRNA lysidine(34) synthetase TilS [Rhodospirillaceae bacterium]|nr:tRNA lysidine(34) synthetase TilS [Rhodospirillaceae bacterium]
MTTPRIVHPAGADIGEALGAAEFARLMAPAGPFEPAPHLAIAVSGGADSMALTLLAAAWARRRKGSVTALTVDHRLRPESGAEARQVGRWLSGRGIAHKILPWRGDKPVSGVQAAARAARMRLLAEWCARHNILHLLSGHQLEDQAGTLMLRLAAGSGGDGLAAMPLVQGLAVQDLAGPGGTSVRLLRPLLSTPGARLRAVLHGHGQAWIDDPSNRKPAYARTRLVAALEEMTPNGLAAPRLARTARRAGQDRAALERACGEALAHFVAPHPAGYFELDWAPWRNLPQAISRRVLNRLLARAGARDFGPRLARLERLWQELLGAYPKHAATLAGCRIVPYRGSVLICREPAAACERVQLQPGDTRRWDRRFTVVLGRGAEFSGECIVGRLGSEGISALRRQLADEGAALARIPAAVRPSLPAFRDLDGVVAVPHLNYARSGAERRFGAAFCPAGSVGGGAFGPVV